MRSRAHGPAGRLGTNLVDQVRVDDTTPHSTGGGCGRLSRTGPGHDLWPVRADHPTLRRGVLRITGLTRVPTPSRAIDRTPEESRRQRWRLRSASRPPSRWTRADPLEREMEARWPPCTTPARRMRRIATVPGSSRPGWPAGSRHPQLLPDQRGQGAAAGAIDRLDLTSMLRDGAAGLGTAGVHLAASLVSLNKVMPESTKRTARMGGRPGSGRDRAPASPADPAAVPAPSTG